MMLKARVKSDIVWREEVSGGNGDICKTFNKELKFSSKGGKRGKNYVEGEGKL